uniref:Uncharacterized protein n=1 Tax=Ralstonia solanacearum TaxID=305 RepID=A0A0S4V2R7_RALSL|nr:protein of unknown function [Ralstonia solanacearum]
MAKPSLRVARQSDGRADSGCSVTLAGFTAGFNETAGMGGSGRLYRSAAKLEQVQRLLSFHLSNQTDADWHS